MKHPLTLLQVVLVFALTTTLAVHYSRPKPNYIIISLVAIAITLQLIALVSRKITK